MNGDLLSEELPMDKVAKGMAEAGEKSGSILKPQKGDRFRCDGCGMQIQVTSDCKCEEDQAQFRCCGQKMRKLYG
jgi:hypothetical protein